MVRAKVFEDNQWFTNRIVFDRDALFSSFLSDKEFVGAQLTKAEHACSFALIATAGTVTLG